MWTFVVQELISPPLRFWAFQQIDHNWINVLCTALYCCVQEEMIQAFADATWGIQQRKQYSSTKH